MNKAMNFSLAVLFVLLGVTAGGRAQAEDFTCGDDRTSYSIKPKGGQFCVVGQNRADGTTDLGCFKTIDRAKKVGANFCK